MLWIIAGISGLLSSGKGIWQAFSAMNTLSNVNKKREEYSPSSNAGLTSDVSLKNRSLPDGVSVEYAPDPKKKWFVLRVTYGREFKAYNFITGDGTEAYLPVRYVMKLCNGKKKRILASLLPNFLFVYATPEKVETYVKHTPELHFLTYYYNHFRVGESGKNPPLTVSYQDMMNFIRVTSIRNEHVRLVESQHCHYKSGDRVRIIDGDFAGIEGRVARVAGQQRVVIELPGVCLVATAYIPTPFIELVPSENEKSDSSDR